MMALIQTLSMAPWFRPFRNAGKLLMGRAAQGVFSVIYTALAARSLGVTDFGTLVLIHSFAITVSQLARFQSWQTVLRFGARALRDGDVAHLQKILKFSFFLDLLSVLIAMAVMLPGAVPAARLFGLAPQSIHLAQIYGFGVIFINMGSAPGGVLRLLDRFDLISLQSALEPAARLVGTVIVYLAGLTLPYYLAVWFIAMVVGKISLNYVAWRELRRRGLLDGLTLSLRDSFNPEPGAWRFAFGTNISTTLGLGQTQLPTLAVGWLLGPAGAGLFKIAQQFASILVKSNSKLLVPAIYADLSHLAASGDHAARRRMVISNGLLAAGAGAALFIVLLVAGKPLVTAIAGKEFLGAYSVLLWLSLAGIIDAALFPFEPLLVSAGQVGLTTIIRFVTSLVYAALLYGLITLSGLDGAGMAAIGFEVISGAWLVFASRKLLSRERQA